jgi:hypothetical protein
MRIGGIKVLCHMNIKKVHLERTPLLLSNVTKETSTCQRITLRIRRLFFDACIHASVVALLLLMKIPSIQSF